MSHRNHATDRRHWSLRAYRQGVGALAIALVVAGAFLIWQVRTVVPLHQTTRAAERVERLTELFGFPARAPVVDQFVAFAGDWLLYPPIFAFLVGGGIVAVALEWRSQTRR